MKRYRFLFLVMIVLAACARSVKPLSSPLEAASTSPMATPFASPTATPDRATNFSNAVIVYQREGGFAGTSDKWTIYPTGRIVSAGGAEWQVPVKQVAPLFALVTARAFAALNTKYMPNGVCNDCFTYTLTVYDQSTPQTVTFVDGADLPPYLQQVLSELNQAITSPAK